MKNMLLSTMIKLNLYSFGIGVGLLCAIPLYMVTHKWLFYYLYGLFGILCLYLFGREIEQYTIWRIKNGKRII